MPVKQHVGCFVYFLSMCSASHTRSHFPSTWQRPRQSPVTGATLPETFMVTTTTLMSLFFCNMTSKPVNTPTSKIHQPSYPCDGHLPLSGSVAELKYKKRTKLKGQKKNKIVLCNIEIRSIDPYYSNTDI